MGKCGRCGEQLVGDEVGICTTCFISIEEQEQAEQLGRDEVEAWANERGDDEPSDYEEVDE